MPVWEAMHGLELSLDMRGVLWLDIDASSSVH